MVVGSAENAKTTTSKEELHATDARKRKEKKIVKENQFICLSQPMKGKRMAQISRIKNFRNNLSFLSNSKANRITLMFVI